MDMAFVCLSENGAVISIKENSVQKEHASFLHLAIKELISENNLQQERIDAIAVTEGPGSYTGLRVGMAAAKGLCYALKKPLICVGTLQMMAHAGIMETNRQDALFCPMVDARRMEVFTALYDNQLNEIIAPQAIILTSAIFSEYLENQQVFFLGNGSPKAKSILSCNPDHFLDTVIFSDSLSYLSYKCFLKGNFSDIVASKPLYIKEPHII